MEKNVSSKASIEFIRSKYLEKRKLNPQYSLTAFARDLGISVSFLSRLMSGERPLTMKQGLQIAVLLGLSSDKTDEFISIIVSESGKNAKLSNRVRETFKTRSKPSNSIEQTALFYEVERFKAMSSWYHLAILNLTYIKGFKASIPWIAKRLGISKIEAMDGVDRLLELGLLEKVGSGLRKTQNHLLVDLDKADLAVREFHGQMIEKAKKALQDPSKEAFDRRYIGGTTVAINEKRMPELKKKLMDFQLEIMQMGSADDATDVYQMNLQLFPITNQGRN